MTGIILLNKPENFKSTDCVNIIRKKLGNIKTGHAGTLDSTASGLLITLTGSASRLSDFIMTLPKIYIAEIKFGAETDTCDYSGEIIYTGDYSHVNNNLIDSALYSFMGIREQVPPEISALKINGKPAYKIKRSGQEVNIKPRAVMIYKISRISDYYEGVVKIKIICGKGTYIRSIARDLGRKFKCGAHLKSLVRFSVGNFTVESDFINSPLDENFKILPVNSIAENFNQVRLNAFDTKKFFNGIAIPVTHVEKFKPGLNSQICILDDNNIGFAELKSGFLKPFANIKTC